MLENLEVAALSRSSHNGANWTRRRVYEVFPKLSELQDNLAGGLSRGERQMLAVGRALMSNQA